MNVSHDALFQNCINGSTPPNRRAARALDKKSFKQHWPPEPQAQIQNNFTEKILIIPSTEIAQMVPLH